MRALRYEDRLIHQTADTCDVSRDRAPGGVIGDAMDPIQISDTSCHMSQMSPTDASFVQSSDLPREASSRSSGERWPVPLESLDRIADSLFHHPEPLQRRARRQSGRSYLQRHPESGERINERGHP